MSQALIPPTVGRVVWFYPSRLTGEAGFAPASGTDPLAAVIAHVWSESLVNLAVFDANGKTHSRTSVKLIHEEIEGDWPANDFCTWMPFQKGQARAQAAAQADSAVASDACKAQSAEPAAKSLSINQRVNDALKAATTGAALQRPSRREQLEAELVAGAARVLAENPNNAKDLAEGIKDFLNVLHPVAAPANPQAGVLYQAICNAMGELGELHPGFNDRVNRAWNYLHRAFWSEAPAPASAPGLRDELPSAEPAFESSDAAASGPGPLRVVTKAEHTAVERMFEAKGQSGRIAPSIVRETIAARRYHAFEQVEAHRIQVAKHETNLAKEKCDHRDAARLLSELDQWLADNPAPVRAA